MPSSSETNKDARLAVQYHAPSVRDRFAPGVPIVTDETALKMDPSSNSVVAYGSRAGHRWPPAWLGIL
jgi:hypothetical protein